MSAGVVAALKYPDGPKVVQEGVEVLPAAATAAARTVGSNRARLGSWQLLLGVLARREGVLIETSCK